MEAVTWRKLVTLVHQSTITSLPADDKKLDFSQAKVKSAGIYIFEDYEKAKQTATRDS